MKVKKWKVSIRASGQIPEQPIAAPRPPTISAQTSQPTKPPQPPQPPTANRPNRPSRPPEQRALRLVPQVGQGHQAQAGANLLHPQPLVVARDGPAAHARHLGTTGGHNDEHNGVQGLRARARDGGGGCLRPGSLGVAHNGPAAHARHLGTTGEQGFGIGFRDEGGGHLCPGSLVVAHNGPAASWTWARCAQLGSGLKGEG